MKKIPIEIIGTVVAVFVTACSTTEPTERIDSNTISVKEQNFVINNLPSDWKKRSSNYRGGYVIEWMNKKGSYISLLATEWDWPKEEPGTKLELFWVSVQDVLHAGYKVEIEELKKKCPSLKESYKEEKVMKHGNMNVPMYRTGLIGDVVCDRVDDLFPMKSHDIGVWTKDHLYIFSLRTSEKYYSEEKVVYESLYKSIRPLSEKASVK